MHGGSAAVCLWLGLISNLVPLPELAESGRAEPERPGIDFLKRGAESFTADRLVSGASASPEAKRPFRFEQRLIVEDPEERFRMEVGERLHFDFSLLSSGPSGLEAPPGSSELRRAFLTWSGKYGRFLAKAEWDFGDGGADIVDLYLGVSDIPAIGRLRFGKVKEPFGVERETSDNNTFFVDRFQAATAFFATRNLGLKVDNVAWKDRIFWSAGMFRDSDGFDAGEGPLNYSGRLSAHWGSDPRRMVQAGLSLSRRNPASSRVRLRRRPNSRFGLQVLDSGTFAASSAWVAAPQFSVLWNRWTVHGTWMRADYDRLPEDGAAVTGTAASARLDSGVIQVFYSLSPGYRPFDRRNAVFKRMTGFKSVTQGGFGGWEIGARLAVLDLNDRDIRGGRATNLTLGLNWHPTGFSRVMLNYLRSDFDQAETENRLLGRLQLTF